MINFIQEQLCKIFKRTFTYSLYSFCYQYIDSQGKLRLGNAIRGFCTKDITIQKIHRIEEYTRNVYPEITNNLVISFSYMEWLKPEEIHEII